MKIYAVGLTVTYRLGSRMQADAVRVLLRASSESEARRKARSEARADGWYDGVRVEYVIQQGSV